MYLQCSVGKLIYVTNFTCTKYVHQRSINFQHVLAHCQGVLSVDIRVLWKCVYTYVAVCSGPLWWRCDSYWQDSPIMAHLMCRNMLEVA